MMNQILIRPLITEKAEEITERNNQYAFVVNKSANKIQIKEAVESEYNVNVESVNTINVLGKRKIRNTKSGLQVGRKASIKKAYVTLSEGEEIDFFGDI